MLSRRLMASARGGASFTPPAGPPADIGQNLTKQGIVLARGSGADWDADLVESPMVYYDSLISAWRMVYVGYATGTSGKLGFATASTPDGPWTKDGDNPFLEGSGSGADSEGCSGPFVWYEGGTYYLIYIGLTSGGYEGGTKSLCLATSTDFASWTRLGAIISPSGSGWRDTAIWHPNVVKRGSTYYLFFNANGAAETTGYATSTNLTTWTVDDANSPVLSGGRVGDPCVYLVGSTWWMAYYSLDAGASDNLASTTDASFPLGWSKYAGNPVLSPSESYDSTYAHKPFILIYGNRYYHWYTAVGTGGRQIALATEDF